MRAIWHSSLVYRPLEDRHSAGKKWLLPRPLHLTGGRLRAGTHMAMDVATSPYVKGAGHKIAESAEAFLMPTN